MAARARQLVSTSALPAATDQRAQQPGVLPEYQASHFTLNANAQRLLHNLSLKYKLDKLNEDLQRAIVKLSDTASDVNERISEHKERDRKRARLASKDVSSTQDSATTSPSEQPESFEQDAQNAVRRTEVTMRKIIDSQHSVQWLQESMATAERHARDHASTQATLPAPSRTRATATRAEEHDSDADDDDAQGEEYSEINPTAPEEGTQPIVGPSVVYRQHFNGLQQTYKDMSLESRYADNADYRNYKNMVHHALYPDGDVPTPAPHTWFQEQPPARPGVTEGGDPDASDEEDIQMTRAVTSTKCPITLQEFKEPLTSNKCPHTYEASAIREMIRHSHPTARPAGAEHLAVQCPVKGCPNMLTLQDLHVDQIILRRIKRLQRARELEDQEMQDRDEGPRDGTQHGAVVVDADGDDGYDIDDIEDDETPAPSRNIKRETRSSMR